jgi:hypothetical protein
LAPSRWHLRTPVADRTNGTCSMALKDSLHARQPCGISDACCRYSTRPSYIYPSLMVPNPLCYRITDYPFWMRRNSELADFSPVGGLSTTLPLTGTRRMRRWCVKVSFSMGSGIIRYLLCLEVLLNLTFIFYGATQYGLCTTRNGHGEYSVHPPTLPEFRIFPHVAASALHS